MYNVFVQCLIVTLCLPVPAFNANGRLSLEARARTVSHLEAVVMIHAGRHYVGELGLSRRGLHTVPAVLMTRSRAPALAC